MATISHPDRFEAWANGLAYLSIAAGLISYYQHNAYGVLLAVLGLLAGAAAIVMSLAPAVRRDLPSTMAICGGVIGVIASVVRLAVAGSF